MPAHATPINVTGTGTVYTGPCTYHGLTLFSAAGATITVYDNTSASGTVLAKAVLGANGDKHIDIPHGVRCTTGIHLVASAAVEGHVRVG
jgi:hypothetical protein